MSNSITQLREEVASAVRLAGITGLQVWAYVPSNLTAPAAVVNPADPYLIPGKVMGEYEVNMHVRLLLSQGSNQVMTTVLDGLIVDVTDALVNDGFAVTQVSAPGTDSESYSTPYLVSDITITTKITGGITEWQE